MLRIMTAATALLLVSCQAETETRTYELQHIRPDEAIGMLEPYVPGGAVNMRLTNTPPALTITAPATRLEQIEGVLRTHDRARPDVQLRFQIIEADGFTATDPAIADVQQALQDLFRFRGYRLVSEGIAQAKAPGRVEQQMAAGERQYSITANLERVITADAGTAVELSIGLWSDPGAPVLTTSLTVPSGQTVVVGSGRTRADGNTLILVVRPLIR